MLRLAVAAAGCFSLLFQPADGNDSDDDGNSDCTDGNGSDDVAIAIVLLLDVTVCRTTAARPDQPLLGAGCSSRTLSAVYLVGKS